MAHWKKRETLFSEYGTSFALPGAWQLRPSEDPCRWHYRSSDKREQLTVSLTDLDGYDEEAEIDSSLLKARRTVELSFNRFPGFELSDGEIGEHDGMPEAGFFGSAGDDAHRFWMWMLFRNGQLWSFFYETFRLREEDALAHMEAFQSSVAFPSEKGRGKRRR